VAQITLSADHCIRAVLAGLDGKTEAAAAWQAAANARDKMLARNCGFDLELRYGCEETVKRADALAEKARLLEAESATMK
jgi:hypothetical protein